MEPLCCFIVYCSLPEGHQSEASLAVQLNLLSLLPRLLLRIKRKWLAFLSDYLQMLLRWWVVCGSGAIGLCAVGVLVGGVD